MQLTYSTASTQAASDNKTKPPPELLSSIIWPLPLSTKMDVPAFGFSVGNIIAAIHLVKRISIALKDSGGAADEYRALHAELQQILIVLEQLRDLPTLSASPLSHHNAVRRMAYEVQMPLKAFVFKMQAYHKRLGIPQNHRLKSLETKDKIRHCDEERRKEDACCYHHEDCIGVPAACSSY